MSDKNTFRVLPEHLTLLRNMYWRWDDCEFGAPAVDSKRPYGNSSVYLDLAEILGVKGEDASSGYEELTREQEEYLWKLHRETETVLAILISSGIMQPGLYKKGSARDALWMRAGD
jgi:hypothetical protein